MHFYMPTKVYQEEYCVRNHAAELASFGEKALILTGPHSAKASGALDDVTDALQNEGVSWTIFNEVEANPSVDTVMRAAEQGRHENCDFVIGVGGGSPMDAAKASALLLKHADWNADKLYETGNPADTVPIVCVPSTCGTGSEVTGVSVLTRPTIDKKGSIPYKIFPDLALVDGRYLVSCKSSLIADTAIDALAHMYESYLNSGADDYSRMLVDRGLSVWKKNKDVLTGERKADMEDDQNMMLASTLAGMAIAQDGTTLPHALSYTLTLDAHMSHGKAVGYFQRGFLKEADPEDRDHLLMEAGFEDVDDMQTFYERVCNPPEVPEKVLLKAVDAVATNPAKLALSPFPTDRDVLMRIAGLA